MTAPPSGTPERPLLTSDAGSDLGVLSVQESETAGAGLARNASSSTGAPSRLDDQERPIASARSSPDGVRWPSNTKLRRELSRRLRPQPIAELGLVLLEQVEVLAGLDRVLPLVDDYVVMLTADPHVDGDGGRWPKIESCRLQGCPPQRLQPAREPWRARWPRG